MMLPISRQELAASLLPHYGVTSLEIDGATGNVIGCTITSFTAPIQWNYASPLHHVPDPIAARSACLVRGAPAEIRAKEAARSFWGLLGFGWGDP